MLESSFPSYFFIILVLIRFNFIARALSSSSSAFRFGKFLSHLGFPSFFLSHQSFISNAFFKDIFKPYSLSSFAIISTIFLSSSSSMLESSLPSYFLIIPLLILFNFFARALSSSSSAYRLGKFLSHVGFPSLFLSHQSFILYASFKGVFKPYSLSRFAIISTIFLSSSSSILESSFPSYFLIVFLILFNFIARTLSSSSSAFRFGKLLSHFGFPSFFLSHQSFISNAFLKSIFKPYSLSSFAIISTIFLSSSSSMLESSFPSYFFIILVLIVANFIARALSSSSSAVCFGKFFSHIGFPSFFLTHHFSIFNAFLK